MTCKGKDLKTCKEKELKWGFENCNGVGETQRGSVWVVMVECGA